MDWRIKLHRQMLEWERHDDPKTFSLFTHCLLMANWEDKKWRWIDVPRWSFITSLSNLSRIVGLSLQQLRTSINKLKSTHNITHQSTNKYSIISICKWEKYQSLEDESTHETTHNPTIQQQTDNNQITTTKEIKNNKNIRRYIYKFDEFWDLYPKKKWKAKAQARYEEAIRNWAEHDRIMEWLDNYKSELRNKWTQEEFIKRPQGRLAEKRWLDDYDTQYKKNNFIPL